jgi:transcriptional regulator with XRE-family HTH domain
MLFAQRLLQARKKRKMSQEELAKMLGVHSPIVGRYERGEVKPSIEVAAKIAEALGVSLDYLTGSTEEELDKAAINRLQQIAKLSPKEKELVFEFLDVFITKAQLKTVMQ